MMRTKIFILGLVCFFIFAYCESPADPEIKKVLNPGSNPGNDYGELIATAEDPPVILYFYEEQLPGADPSTHCLYWSVAESPAATVTTSWRAGEVPLISTGSCMTVEETTIYTLYATNAAGQTTESLTIVPKKRAILEITTIPEVPIFHYDDSTPYYEKSESTFTLVITETNGVGGHLNYIEITFPDGRCIFSCVYHVDFIPSDSVSYLFDVCANGKPTSMAFRSYCIDENGYESHIRIEIPFTWDN